MKIDLLDHGYIEFIEASGTGKIGNYSHASPDYEVGIIEAARQSTQKGFQGWDSDTGLLAYLYNNQHMTPFEFADCVIEVQAPIVVFREWHRHRTQSYNEMSARYAPLPDLYYVPDIEDLCERAMQARITRNKQAGSTVQSPADRSVYEGWLQQLRGGYNSSELFYQGGLEIGVPKELARLLMPVGHYTRMRAKANLRNWLSFMTLRSAPNAMKEIRVYSDALGTILAHYFPRTFALFEDARRKAERDRKIVEVVEEMMKEYSEKAEVEGLISIRWVDELENLLK